MTNFQFIDIHSHLNFPDFEQDRETLISKMIDTGVGAINVGTSIETSREVVALAGRCENLWAIVGVHPHEAGKGFDLAELKELATKPKVVAIGECGLDYFRIDDKETKIFQRKLFEDQIEIALGEKLPLMLHIRDSYKDVLDILENYPQVKSHAHFFAGDWDIAKRFLDRGDTISFTGVITFANQYDEVVKKAPLDQLMVETDCPYVAPVPFRGKRNEPAHVKYVVKKVAEIRNVEVEVIRKAMVSNARRVFNL